MHYKSGGNSEAGDFSDRKRGKSSGDSDIYNNKTTEVKNYRMAKGQYGIVMVMVVFVVVVMVLGSDGGSDGKKSNGGRSDDGTSNGDDGRSYVCGSVDGSVGDSDGSKGNSTVQIVIFFLEPEFVEQKVPLNHSRKK